MKSGTVRNRFSPEVLTFLLLDSVYGFPDFDGDANDFWRVEIVDHDKRDPISKDRLRTIHSRFRLVHVMENCALFSHNVKLPDWGWGQQEVTCIKNGKIPKSIWYVESTVNALCKFCFFSLASGFELCFLTMGLFCLCSA